MISDLSKLARKHRRERLKRALLGDAQQRFAYVCQREIDRQMHSIILFGVYLNTAEGANRIHRNFLRLQRMALR